MEALWANSAAVTRAVGNIVNVTGSEGVLAIFQVSHNPVIESNTFYFIQLYTWSFYAGLWVSIDSLKNRKQNNFEQEDRNTA